MNSQQAWAYATAVFETSGWATLQKRPSRRTAYTNIVFGMSRHSPLVKVHGVTGGRLNGPYARTGGGLVPQGHYAQRYMLILARKADIERFLDHCYAELSKEKRDAIREILAGDTRYGNGQLWTPRS